MNPHREEIIRLRKAGIGPRRIARKLRLTPNAVAGILSRAGLTEPSPAHRDYSDRKRNQVLRDAETLGVVHAADEHGVAESTVRLWRLQAPR